MQTNTVKIQQMGLLADKEFRNIIFVMKSNRKEVIQDDGGA